jgi:hypothetical protein
VNYAIRLSVNDNLERNIRELLTRSSGPAELQAGGPVSELSLQGGELETARRVVAKVESHFGELFPRVGFIVTNLAASGAVMRFYNRRGTAEQCI